MAFVAENGTGLATANSLCSVAFADEYFTDRGDARWAGDASAKQRCLILATDYVEGRWSQRLKGEKRFPAVQALSFPRLYIDNDDAVPAAVMKAVAEYAMRELTTPRSLAPDPTSTASGQTIKRLREKVEGALEVETEYASPSRNAPSFPAADRLMRQFVAYAGVVR